MGDPIQDAYKSVVGSAIKDASQSTKQNLWEFLGLNNAKPDQVACMFDCSSNGSECLKKCDDDSCKFGCTSKGIKCMKNCVLEKVTTASTVPNLTDGNMDNVLLDSNCVNMDGVCNAIDYAPFDSKIWPQYSPSNYTSNSNFNSNSNKMGWDIAEIYASHKASGDTNYEIDFNKYKFIYKKDKSKTEIEKEKQLLREIKLDSHKLENLSSKYTHDKVFMIKAVSENWRALEYASEELKQDRELVEIAVKQNWVALQYAGDKYKPALEWV